jgi:predicted metalloprotease with PDZ domain
MKIHSYFIFLCLFAIGILNSQSKIQYEISFKNAVHHEAAITVHFEGIKSDTLAVRMSRTSPGRYAIHEFAKNVYGFKAVDENGKELIVNRPNPYQWDVSGHHGTVKIYYTLFANHGDGTYSQVDETHAHLNIPATFIFSPQHENTPIHIKFHPREDLNWKIATQLKHFSANEYYAPDLAYFMDSPVEISDHKVKSFKMKSNSKDYDINFVLHQAHDHEGFDDYFENVKSIVKEEVAVFGELPEFDFGSYTFLACYISNIAGDGMEHRNSTILTDLKSLSAGGDKENISTVAHEFFHAWNVERIRPLSLEPFDFTEANMSGELWFAEGFTSYYTNLTLCRAGIITRESYASGLSNVLSYVWNSPGRNYFNPIEMSYQAPFVDAATSVDQVNWANTFISYYSYGNVLGLALDLSLRNLEGNKTLDGFMKLVWQNYGKNEVPYTIKNLEDTLTQYVSEPFSSDFFNNYIYQSKMPDYTSLLKSVGIEFSYKYEQKPSFGASIQNLDNKWLISSNPQSDSSSYNAGLSKGDEIVSIDGKLTNNKLIPNDFFMSYKPGDTVKVVYNRFGQGKETIMVFKKNRSYKTVLEENPEKNNRKRRENWLKKRGR